MRSARRLSVLLGILLVNYRPVQAHCSASKAPDGTDSVKCWDATLAELWATRGPVMTAISIANSAMNELPAFAFGRYTNSLLSLALSDCKISQINENAFAGLTSLRKLNLANNRLTTVQSQWFTSLASLQELDLSFNEIRAVVGTVFARLTNLRLLNLNHNRLTCLQPKDMEPMRSIVKIYVVRNPLSLECRGRMTRWFADKGIKYLHDLDTNTRSWLDRVIWLCAQDLVNGPPKNETQMQYCVLGNVFDQLRMSLKTTDSYRGSAEQCMVEREVFGRCLASGVGGSRTKGLAAGRLIGALEVARRGLVGQSRLPAS